MSGAYIKQKPTMNQGGWKVFEPRGPSGKYSRYDNQIVVIIAGKGKEGRALYLTSAVLQVLGKPTYVQVMTRGSNVGVMASETSQDAYKVMQGKTKLNGEVHTGMRFLNLLAFGKAFNVTPGVYDAHVENGVIVFDLQSTPSRP